MSLTVEESNFLRFYYLNLKVATKAVRVYFDHIHRQGRLEWKLKKNETHLKSRDNLITSHQINIVYPSSGHIVNSDQFDTTLMICLLRNMKPYTVEYANDKGWDKFPPATDTSYLADLARVKWYRNFVSHHKGELTAADFNWHCRNLEPAIGRLGGQTLLIEARSAQHVILDTSLKDMLLELRNCEKSLQGMTDKINSHQLSLDLLTTNEEELVEKIHKMEAETQELKTKLSDYKGTIDACTKELETCKNDIKTNKEIMKGLQNQSDKKQNEIENLITRIDKLEIEYEQHDKMLKEHGEHLVMHDGQVIQLQEHLVMHDGQLEKCEKQIHDIKEKQHDTDVTSVRSKQKRLEEDTRALIKEDVKEDTFVATKAVTDGLALLKQNGVLLITGHAGTGKSRIGRHVLHMFCTENKSLNCMKLTLAEWDNITNNKKEKDNREENMNNRKEDMENREENIDNSVDNLVLLLDDIFGETYCMFNREKDTSILDKIYAYVCKDWFYKLDMNCDGIDMHCIMDERLEKKYGNLSSLCRIHVPLDWFYKLDLNCDGIDMHCIIDQRLERKYGNLSSLCRIHVPLGLSTPFLNDCCLDREDFCIPHQTATVVGAGSQTKLEQNVIFPKQSDVDILFSSIGQTATVVNGNVFQPLWINSPAHMQIATGILTEKRIFRMYNQIIVNLGLQPGDSGTCIYVVQHPFNNNGCIGMAIAFCGGMTVVTPLKDILKHLNR